MSSDRFTHSVAIAAVHPDMGTAKLPWPARKTAQASGFDCCAAIDEPMLITTGYIYKIPLGFALGLPDGWEAQIRPRSGLSSEGLLMPNSPGTIDADYRGQIHAIFYYLDLANSAERGGLKNRLTIRPGDRIAQMVFSYVPNVGLNTCPLDHLSHTARGTKGFGSTGLSAS